MPITWKNVARSNPYDSHALESANRMVSGAMDGLTTQLTNAQAQNQAVIDRGREASVNSVMMKLNEISSPEQYAEMEKTGQFKAMLSGLDPRDQAALMQAPQAKLDSLKLRSDQDYARTKMLDQRASQPFVLDAMRQSLLGNEAVALQAAEGLSGEDQLRVLQQTKLDSTNRANTAFALSQRDRNVSQQALTDADAAIKRGDVNEDRLINNLTATTAKQYSDGILKGRKLLGTLAAAKGLPIDEVTGVPNVTGMSQEQLNQLTQLSSANNLPNWQTLFTGDTSQRDSFLQNLGTQSGVTPAGIQRNRAIIDGAFNTLGISKKIGVDQFGVDRANAQADIYQEDKDKNIWLPAGSANTAAGFDDLWNNAGKLIDTTTGIDPEDDVGPIRNFIAKMGREGITAPDGTKWIPSIKDMKAVIGSAEGGWMRDKKRAENAEEALKELLKSKSMTVVRQQAEESEKYSRTRRLREKLYPPTK